MLSIHLLLVSNRKVVKSMAELESLHNRHQGDHFFIPTVVGHEHHNKVFIFVMINWDTKCLILMPAINQITFVRLVYAYQNQIYCTFEQS
jgi:hypothetical protein